MGPESRGSKRQAVGQVGAQKKGAKVADEEPNPPDTEEQLTAQQVLSEVVGRKLAFKRGVSVTKKLEGMGGFIKEQRAAGEGMLQEFARVEQEMESWKAKAEEEVKARGKENEEFALEKKKMEEDINQLKNDMGIKVQDVKEALMAKEKELATIEDKLRRADDAHDNLQACNSNLQEKMQQAHERNEKLLEEVTRLSGSLQKNMEEAERARIEVNNELMEVKGENAALKSKEKMLEEQHLKDVQQIEHRQQELSHVTNDRDAIKRELVSFQDQMAKLKESSCVVQEEMKNMEYTKAALEGHFTDQGAVVDDLRRQLRIAQEGQKLTSHLTEQKDIELSELKVEKEKLQEYAVHLEEKVQDGEKLRKKLHNTILELKGNIRVFGRVRCAAADEETTDSGTSNPIVSFPTKGEAAVGGISLMAPPAPRQPFQNFTFNFDHMFTPKSTQHEVFEEISQLVQSALDGYKVCVFAYGQTGSGKTYTMLGTKEEQGIIPRAMNMLFTESEELKSQGWKYAMHAGMLEIYNEDIRDLLVKGSTGGKTNKVSHDQHGNTTVSGLTLVDVQDPGQIERLLSTAMAKRAVGATKLNEVSSRSHMVFMLKIDGYNSNTHQSVHGVLNLVDLAGSERVKESGAAGDRLREAQNINKSLSALGDVIMALINKSDHIPYRNSCLTRLLQPSLGGNAKTLMFVNIAPTRTSASESLCSLRFASKVNACEVGVAKRSVGNKNTQKSLGP